MLTYWAAVCVDLLDMPATWVEEMDVMDERRKCKFSCNSYRRQMIPYNQNKDIRLNKSALKQHE